MDIGAGRQGVARGVPTRAMRCRPQPSILTSRPVTNWPVSQGVYSAPLTSRDNEALVILFHDVDGINFVGA